MCIRDRRYTERMDEKDELILASGSPRRKELLARTGRPFRIIVSDADEIETANMPPTEVAMRLSLIHISNHPAS